MNSAFKYIYGPVPSWRLGSSLGIDLLTQEEKICNFDCVYCQLGPTKGYTVERKAYVAIEEVIKELEILPKTRIDYLTFSGRGEPTLASNLGEAIKEVRSIREEPIAVLTNATLMDRDDVRKDLISADFVVAKLDACSQESLREINRPAKGIESSGILKGIKEFKKGFRGKLALQIMFIDINRDYVDNFIYLADCIQPDEIQVNTPLRPCDTNSLAKEDVLRIKDRFISACGGIHIVSVYDERTAEDIVSISDKDTLKRRGKVI